MGFFFTVIMKVCDAWSVLCLQNDDTHKHQMLIFTVPSFTKSRGKEMISGWIDSNISGNLNNAGIDHLSPLSRSRIREETGLCKHRSSAAGTLCSATSFLLCCSVVPQSRDSVGQHQAGLAQWLRRGGAKCDSMRGVYMLPFWWPRAKYWTYSREAKSSIDPVIISISNYQPLYILYILF